MKKMLLLCGALLLVSASAAMALPTLHMNWDSCSETGGTKFQTFSCTVNNGLANNLVLSMTPDIDLPTFQGALVDVTVGTVGQLPTWWLANCSTARTSVFGFAADNTALATGCSADAYGGGPAGFSGIGSISQNTTNSITVEAATANAAGSEPSLTAGVEVYLGNVTIKHAGSAGALAATCTGCSTVACINFNHGLFDYLGHPSVVVDGKLAAGDTWVTWGSNSSSPGACAAATPTHTSSWGQMKALYR